MKIVMQHLESPVPRLPQFLDEYQPLMDRMLAKRREDRFETAEQLVAFIDDLRAEQDAVAPGSTGVPGGTGTESAATPTPYMTGMFTGRWVNLERKRARAWGGFAALVLSVAALLMLYFFVEIHRYDDLGAARASAARTVAAPDVPAPEVQEAGAESTMDATPANDEDQRFREEVIKALTWLGQRSLEEERLTTPPRDNAYYYYSRLLEIDPDSEVAMEGLAGIAQRYATLAETQMERGHFDKAEIFIISGLEVDPENKRLLVLRSKMQLREKSFFENVIDLFRG